jgi:hypothetical protein
MCDYGYADERDVAAVGAASTAVDSDTDNEPIRGRAGAAAVDAAVDNSGDAEAPLRYVICSFTTTVASLLVLVLCSNS